MNSTTFSLSPNNNSKIDGNQITFGAIDFQPHPPILTPVFESLDQEMDQTIESPNFLVGSLGTIRLSDLTNSGPSAGKTVSATRSESSVGSSSKVNSPVSFKPTENIEDTVEELDEIMENLGLGKSSGHPDKDFDKNRDNKNQPIGDFMICCGSTSDKSTCTWKTGLELHVDDQTIFSSSSSKINHQYQVFAIIGDNLEEFDNSNNPILNPSNITRGANLLAEGDTIVSLTTTAKVRLTAESGRQLSVFWIPGYPGPPAPGPLQWPSFGLGADRRPKPSKEDPHEEAPHEENDGKTVKDQKTSSRGIPREGKDHIHVSSTRSSVGREDKDGRWCTVHATPTRGRPAPAVPA
jgi:hypothetical protein